jgi:hypothetical protein
MPEKLADIILYQSPVCKHLFMVSLLREASRVSITDDGRQLFKHAIDSLSICIFSLSTSIFGAGALEIET